jgi:hypothetical protein
MRESLITHAVPTIMASTKREKWRRYIDSMALNKITIKYKRQLLRIDYVMDCSSRTRYFSKIDLKSGYHQIIIREGNEWKTTFKTEKYVFKSMVMPIRMTKCTYYLYEVDK